MMRALLSSRERARAPARPGASLSAMIMTGRHPSQQDGDARSDLMSGAPEVQELRPTARRPSESAAAVSEAPSVMKIVTGRHPSQRDVDDEGAGRSLS